MLSHLIRRLRRCLGSSHNHANFLFFHALAALSAVTSLGWFYSAVPCPVLQCDHSVDQSLISVLRGQLDRCGPAELGARPCPPCPDQGSRAESTSLETRLKDLALLGPVLYTLGVVSTYAFYQLGPVEPRVGGDRVPALTDGNRWVPSEASLARRIS